MAQDKNIYTLSRNWFNFCFENPQKIKPIHTALYFFCIEHCNRLGWKDNFGLPTTMAKEAIGIHSYNTYIKALNDLVSFGFIKLVQKSYNQYSSNIIALSGFNKAHDKALDKALIKHVTKQRESTSSILKQDNNITNQQNIVTVFSFDEFWNAYDYKTGKSKAQTVYAKLSEKDRQLIKDTLQNYLNSVNDKKYLKQPLTYLNQKIWNDELFQDTQTNNVEVQRDLRGRILE